MTEASEAADSFVASSVFVPVGQSGARLHLRRLRPQGSALRGAVLMLHGAIENGRIFYSDSGKGLGPFLARAGFEVFAADLRGRGLSTPRVGRGVDFGQTELITEDLPALSNVVRDLSDGAAQHWVAHSWGGVLAFSAIARIPELAARVTSMTCFGTKRSIAVSSWEKVLRIDLFWDRAFGLVTRAFGYLPARRLGIGGDDESRSTHAHSVCWVNPANPWVDPVDGFDYAAAIRKVTLPRTLHLTGIADRYLGHPQDVRRFAHECGLPPDCVRVLSLAAGNRRDYDHIDILTRVEAEGDHFPMVAGWIAGTFTGN